MLALHQSEGSPLLEKHDLLVVNERNHIRTGVLYLNILSNRDVLVHKGNKAGSPNRTRRSELPNTREKIPVMNVHKPPSIDVPVKIGDCSTSLINSFDP